MYAVVAVYPSGRRLLSVSQRMSQKPMASWLSVSLTTESRRSAKWVFTSTSSWPAEAGNKEDIVWIV